MAMGAAAFGQALPPVAPAASAAASAAQGEAEVADRMARAKRVADDPLRRIREAARLPTAPGSPAATPAPATAAAPAAQPRATAAAPTGSGAPTTGAAGAPGAAGVVTVTLPAAARRVATADPREAIGRLMIQVARETEAANSAAAAAAASAPAPATSLASAAPVAPAVAAAASLGAAPAAAPAITAPAVQGSPAAQADDTAARAMPVQAVAALSPGVSTASTAATTATTNAVRQAAPAAPAAGAGDAVAVPALLQMVEPDFAGRGLRETDSLRFQVRFLIAADGSVQDVVVQGGADRQLQRLVRDAVSRWRYAPPARPLPHSVDLVVRFDT